MTSSRSFPASLHRPLAWLTVAMVVLAIVSAVGWVVDERQVNGAAIWAKPFKFSVSFGIYAFTLAWLVSLMPEGRLDRLARRWSTVLAAALALETGAIVLQVVRGRASHFNRDTPFDTAVYGAMGAFAVVIFVTTVIVGVLVLRGSNLADRSLVWSLRLGLPISLAGMSIGFLMARPTAAQIADPDSPTFGAHGVGAPDGGPSIPVVGWSSTAGDLRVGHFIGLHALQALPLLALLMTVRAIARVLDERARARLVVIAAAAYTALFVLTLWQALRGQALTSPDAATWTALVALTLVTSTAVAVTLRVGRRRSGERDPGTASPVARTDGVRS